jgi:hypothetical protein
LITILFVTKWRDTFYCGIEQNKSVIALSSQLYPSLHIRLMEKKKLFMVCSYLQQPETYLYLLLDDELPNQKVVYTYNVDYTDSSIKKFTGANETLKCKQRPLYNVFAVDSIDKKIVL